MSKNVKSEAEGEIDILGKNESFSESEKWREIPWSCKPNPPSSNFAGRRDYLEKIRSVLLGQPSSKNPENEPCTETKLLVISGPSGIGKREMARKIVSELQYHHSKSKSNMEENPAVFLWFDMSSHDSLFLCLYDICWHFKLKTRMRLKEMKNGGKKWRPSEKLAVMMQELYNYFYENNIKLSIVFANVRFPMDSFESGDKKRGKTRTGENSLFGPNEPELELAKYFPSTKTSENAQLFIIVAKTNLTSFISDEYYFQNYLAEELKFKFKLCHVDLLHFREAESQEFLKNVFHSSTSNFKYELKVDLAPFDLDPDDLDLHQVIRRPHIFALGVPFTLNLFFHFLSYELKFKKESETMLNLEHEIFDFFKYLDSRQVQQRAHSISNHFNPMEILMKFLYETIKEESQSAARFLGKIVLLAPIPLRANFLAQIYAQTAQIPNEASQVLKDFKKDVKFLETLAILKSHRINPMDSNLESEEVEQEFSTTPTPEDAIYQKYFELHENFREFIKKRVLFLPQEDGQTLLLELNKTLNFILKGQDLSLDLIAHCKNVRQIVKTNLKTKFKSNCCGGFLPKEDKLRKIISNSVVAKMGEILHEKLKGSQILDFKAGKLKIENHESFEKGSFLYEISAENYTLRVLKMLFKYNGFQMVAGVAMETLMYLSGLRGQHLNHVVFTKKRSAKKVTKKVMNYKGRDILTLLNAGVLLTSKFEKEQSALSSLCVENTRVRN